MQKQLQHTIHTPGYSRPTTPGISPPQLAFVGLGSMGYEIAKNLATHKTSHPHGSHPLLVWNRTPAKSQKLLDELGPDLIAIAKDIAQVAHEADIIFSCLATDEVIEDAYQQYSQALANHPSTKNKIFVEMSTIYPTLAGRLDKLISSVPHAHLVTSPVFGTPIEAKGSQLVIVMSGDYRSKKELAYILVPAIGRKIVDLGGNVEKAPTFKLLGNSLILGSLEILAESLTLAEKSGIGAESMHQLVQDLLPEKMLVSYSDRMTQDNFEGATGFALEGGIKDASNIRRLTNELNSPMPTVDVAHQRLLTARALHQQATAAKTSKFETLDWSSIVAGSRVAAGLDAFDTQKHSKVELDD